MTKIQNLLVFICTLGLLGCGAEPAPKNVQEVQYAPISVSDAKVKAAKFVSDLESVPPAQRGQFVFAHLQEAHAIGVSGDAELQARFKALVGASQ